MIPVSEVPERSLLPFLLAQRRDPLEYLTRTARELGDVVYFSLGPTGLLLLSHPDLIQEVLVKRAREFSKAQGPQSKVIPWGKAILGSGLLISEGDTWLRSRRLMQQAFHRQRIESYIEVMANHAGAMISRWSAASRDMHAELTHLTIRVMAECVFGLGPRADEIESALRGLFGHRSPRSATFVLPEWIPTFGNLRTGRALRRMNTLIYSVIDERRAHPAGEDLLSMLLSAPTEEGEPLGDVMVRDEVMSTFVAGHDTLSSTLTWMLWTISEQSDVERRLVDELGTVADRKRYGTGDLAKSSLIAMAAQEALRLFPPAKSITRVAIQDCEVGGRRISRGTYVVMSQWVVQRDPRFFERPDVFDLDRWRDDAGDHLPRFAYFPFGGGPRLCLGFAFAEAMLRVTLAEVLSRVRLMRDPDPARGEWDPATLRPSHGIWMRAIPR